MKEIVKLYQIINERKNDSDFLCIELEYIERQKRNVIMSFDCNLLIQYSEQSKKALESFTLDEIENNINLMFLYLREFASLITHDVIKPQTFKLFPFLLCLEKYINNL